MHVCMFACMVYMHECIYSFTVAFALQVMIQCNAIQYSFNSKDEDDTFVGCVGSVVNLVPPVQRAAGYLCMFV